MFIVCVICRDYVTDSSSTSITRCGHIFHSKCLLDWISRSQSCPQCRKKSSAEEINKVYLTFPNDKVDEEDIAATDNLNFQILLYKKNVEYYTTKNEKLMKQNDGLIQEIRKVEKEMVEKKSNIRVIKSRMMMVESENNVLKNTLDEKEMEIEKLKRILEYDSSEDKTNDSTELEQVHAHLFSTLRKQVSTLMESLENLDNITKLAYSIMKTLFELNHKFFYLVKNDPCLAIIDKTYYMSQYKTFCDDVSKFRKDMVKELVKWKYEVENGSDTAIDEIEKLQIGELTKLKYMIKSALGEDIDENAASHQKTESETSTTTNPNECLVLRKKSRV